MSEHASEQKISDWATLTPPGTLPVLDNIFQVSDKFLGQLKLHLEQHPPSIPITSILGFLQFTARFGYDASLYQTSSSTFQAPGPSITGVQPGRYISFLGAQAQGSATSNADAAVFVDNAANGPEIITRSTSLTSVFAAAETVITTPNATVDIQYKSSDNATTCSWQGRMLILLRYANI